MEGLSRNTPTLFRYKIGSFSSFATSSVERFESCEFDAGDYKWKLCFYPNGNKEKGGKDHISLYLMLANSSSFDPNKEILVSFRLFALDHIRDKCLLVQEVSRFNAQKSESGFDKFLSIGTFSDPSKGYLVEDTCMFGVEIISIVSIEKSQSTPATQSTPANSNDVPFIYRWKVKKFSTLKDLCHSETFKTGGYDWRMSLYPKGHLIKGGKSLSLYVGLADNEDLSDGTQVHLKLKLRVIDQVKDDHLVKGPTTGCLGGSIRDWGYCDFAPLGVLNDASRGYLKKNTCIVEAEIISVLTSHSDQK
ncbi:hypothetical protein ACHQM5_008741 [Ranunculus cassubicifolius]